MSGQNRTEQNRSNRADEKIEKPRSVREKIEEKDFRTMNVTNMQLIR